MTDTEVVTLWRCRSEGENEPWRVRPPTEPCDECYGEPFVPVSVLAAARTGLDETRSDRDYWRTRAAEQTERAESSEAVAVQLREALDEAREHLTEAERLMSVLLATNPYDRDGILEDIALFVESPDSLTSRAVLSGSPQPEGSER